MLPGRLTELVVAGLALLPIPLAAQDLAPIVGPAAPGSVEDLTGRAILYYVGGRTRDEAMQSGNDFNPFLVNGEDLLYTLGAFFVSTRYEGRPVNEGELSIFPQFVTPMEAFVPAPATPAIIPFAVMQQGICHAGYVAGHPVPDTVYAVDLSGRICHAATVEEAVRAVYAEASAAEPDVEPVPPAEVAPADVVFDPAAPSDVDLDVIVWAAYNGVLALAMSDPEYLFMRDGDFAAVRQAVLAGLADEGYGGVSVADRPAASTGPAFACAEPGRTEVRIAFLAGNAGIAIAAASDRRRSTYVYDPAVSVDLQISTAHDCGASGIGRTPTVNVP